MRIRSGAVPVRTGSALHVDYRLWKQGRMEMRVSSTKVHLVDALAPRGDEGRGTLRKAAGRCERSLIRGCPNGETPPQGDPGLNT